ncbi:MAG TPA: BMP family ABC transporter substrate-binding protein [Symbiobacteriaceae bacterium]|nr:BMP family ABC transporter substrate-binding protein [Symbiobacteriaceae bacterium]
MRKIFGAVIAVMLMLGLVVGCGGAKTESQKPAEGQKPAETKSEKLKVAFVYVGPIGDGGYTYAHDQGRLQLEKELGEKVTTSYLESVPEGADAERVFEELAQKNNVVIGTSFGYMDAMAKVAKKYPKVTFLHCSGYMTDKNLGTYFGRNHEAFYLSGIVAGLQIKSNIGMVAAHPIPEVIRAINAFTLGARSVNPNVKVKVVWTNTWFDPAKEKDAANSLLDLGAELIAMYQDSPGPLQAAQEKGKTAIGNDTDSRQYAPKAFLTAPVWNWGPYYVKVTKQILEGTWKTEEYMGGMSDDMVRLAPIADFAHKDAKAKTEEAQKKIAGGWNVFTGPINGQDGKVKIEAGKSLSQKEWLEMNWFVEGVDGTIPK